MEHIGERQALVLGILGGSVAISPPGGQQS